MSIVFAFDYMRIKKSFSEKNMPIKNAKTVEELKELLLSDEPANLSKVLAAFDLYMPVLA